MSLVENFTLLSCHVPGCLAPPALKKSLTTTVIKLLPRTVTLFMYRGATLLCGIRTLIGILSYSRQLTHALTSWNTRRINSFDHALSGPFNKLRSAGSQLIRLSVSAHLFLSQPQRFLCQNSSVRYLILENTLKKAIIQGGDKCKNLYG